MRDFRKTASEIYEKFPFFQLPKEEFRNRCLPLQRCGAGIVLGHAKKDFEVRVVAVSSGKSFTRVRSHENLPLGHFGEIVFRRANFKNFTHTELYGFFDQRGRVWCCGKIADVVSKGGQEYFPYCIEPLFERLWWVRSAKFDFVAGKSGEIALRISVSPRRFLLPWVGFFEKIFLKKLEAFSKRFKVTASFEKFRIAKLES
ncbi:MAG: hypothetical protein LBI61_02975 [Puniceicoccales bacterium]|jgi:hypothetical protein|nr:hypothetical protein [Puniceicoccales bacterium]